MPDNENLRQSATKMVGRTIGEAKNIYPFVRVAKQDGVPLFLTMDMNPNRINVETEEGKITKISGYY